MPHVEIIAISLWILAVTIRFVATPTEMQVMHIQRLLLHVSWTR